MGMGDCGCQDEGEEKIIRYHPPFSADHEVHDLFYSCATHASLFTHNI